MTTKYSVVRYLPNPLSGEAVNFGVIAWNQDRISSRFIDNWKRVRAFGGEDIDFLREFRHRFETRTSQAPTLPGFGDKLDAAELERIVGDWRHSIEFSEPRSSLKSPDEVLNDLAPIYLRSLGHRPREMRDRRVAARLAAKMVSDVLISEKGPGVRDLIQRDYALSGQFDRHTFDVAVANGQAFLAAQALSFEGSSSPNLHRDIDATAWAIDDVRKKLPRLPLRIFALPPRGTSKLFTLAKRIFAGLDAKIVSENQMGRWVHEVSGQVPTATPKIAQGPRAVRSKS